MLGCWPEAASARTGFAAAGYFGVPHAQVVSAASNLVSERSERRGAFRRHAGWAPEAAVAVCCRIATQSPR